LIVPLEPYVFTVPVVVVVDGVVYEPVAV